MTVFRVLRGRDPGLRVMLLQVEMENVPYGTLQSTEPTLVGLQGKSSGGVGKVRNEAEDSSHICDCLPLRLYGVQVLFLFL